MVEDRRISVSATSLSIAAAHAPEAHDGWSTYPCGPIELRYRPRSYAAHEIDLLATRFVAALGTTQHVLGMDPGEQSRIVIYVVDEMDGAEVDERAG